jgi:hypothetical protein
VNRSAFELRLVMGSSSGPAENCSVGSVGRRCRQRSRRTTSASSCQARRLAHDSGGLQRGVTRTNELEPAAPAASHALAALPVKGLIR